MELEKSVGSFTDAEIDDIGDTVLNLKYFCHNQVVERPVKVVTEASSQVVRGLKEGIA